MRNKINLCVLMVVVVLLLVKADSLYAIWPQQSKLTASDGAESSYFGWSVSISGNYVIVGAFWDDDKGYESGSAYIFKYDGTSWLEQQKLTASDGAAVDEFGDSVSISGNYAIVGAVGDDDKGDWSGSAYVFKYDGTTWMEQQKLTASDGAEGGCFGASVSISGNYAIVGADGDDSKGVRSGSAYIFKYDGTTWVEQAKLTASDGAEEDRFGTGVSISGDYAIVGAVNDSDKGYATGSAYIFKYDGITWIEQQKLTASDGAEGDFFGESVSISGNYAIVGARLDDDKGYSSGSAYIFKYDSTTWIEHQKLTASDGAELDFFGISVSINGNYAVVGTPGDADKGYASGSAYIFKYDGINWMEQQKLAASDGAANDSFGSSVSISGDHVIVGADLDNNKGSAYVFMNGMPCWNCPWQPYGDINGDGNINSADYFSFKKSYGTGWATHSHGEMIGQYNCCCDLNHDLKVNATDYFIFKKNYGRTGLRRCAVSSCL